jgi:hypothetical protein
MVPPVSDPRWRSIVTGTIAFEPTMLATQILMGRLLASVRSDQSQDNVSRAISDLRAFFEKYETIAAIDLALIFC